MPTFRLTNRDGTITTVHAARAVVSSDDVRFQVRHGGAWTQISSARLDDLRVVERQLTEYDGRRRYVADREVAKAITRRESLALHGVMR